MNSIDRTVGHGTTQRVPFGANAIRLSAVDWAIVAVVTLSVLALLPAATRRIGKIETSRNYRVPYYLSQDYWLYERLIEQARARDAVFLVGDSVIWGEFVTPDQALSAALGRQYPDRYFVNAGINAIHPLALEGLIRFYARPMRRSNVLLHFNPLWLSSRERDLSASLDREVTFNHPRLIPQLVRTVPSYRATPEKRLGVLFDRHMEFRRCVQHFRIADFDNMDLHTWTLENSWENPYSRIESGTPPMSIAARHLRSGETVPRSWFESGAGKMDPEWIKLDDSLQWNAFERTIQCMTKRDNDVLVVVGPFNEHMLSHRGRYSQLLIIISGRLSEIGVSHCVPDLLPTEHYGDASHPLADGYERIAQWLTADRQFKEWLGSRRNNSIATLEQ